METPHPTTNRAADAPPDLRGLLHRLNNQLGVIIANAELLEVKVTDDRNRARAAQVVDAALGALTVARDLRALASAPASD